MKTNMIKSSEFRAYQKYLQYYDSLQDACARYPYSIIEENPPDNNYMYYRKMTYDEFLRNKSMRMEFLNESIQTIQTS